MTTWTAACQSFLCFTLDTVRSFFLLLFGLYVVSDSLGPHELRYTRLPCPSLSPGVCSNSCPLSQRCHPTISSSVIPFSSCLQSFPASESLPMSGIFASGGQSIGASALVSVLPMNEVLPQGLPLWLTCKESAHKARDLGSIPGLGSFPGEGNSCPLQYSGLENSMDCIVYGVAKSWT